MFGMQVDTHFNKSIASMANTMSCWTKHKKNVTKWKIENCNIVSVNKSFLSKIKVFSLTFYKIKVFILNSQ